MIEKMQVYFDKEFRNAKKEKKILQRMDVWQDFEWEDVSGFVPAVYLGVGEMALDLCIRIPIEKMEGFLEKWNQERRQSTLTKEEIEQMERENPCVLEFSMDVTVDGERLIFDHSFSEGWHPLEVERECIGEMAKDWMEEYQCDRKDGWLFERRFYRFEEKKKRVPHSIRCCFRANPVPFHGAHFFTEENCEGHEIAVTDPTTEELYQLTIYGCRAEKIEEFPQERQMQWPQWCQVLSYSVQPEISQSEFQIVDCAESDSPRKIGLKTIFCAAF